MSNKPDDIWGFRKILNTPYKPRWWQLIIHYRRWRAKRNDAIRHKRRIKDIMTQQQCDYTEAEEYIEEEKKERDKLLDATIRNMTCRLLGDE